jgi:organic radical activating enzyme
MTYFLLSITNTCNKSCGYCVVKPWLNNPEYPDKITAADIMDFLEKEMQPGDAVELTGGEPTLFPGLLLLLEWLKEHGAKVIMRTNGLWLDSWRKEFPGMVLALARHDSSDSYMEERKRHLMPWDKVVDKIPDDEMQKEQDRPVFKKGKDNPLTAHPFKKMFFVTNDGKIRFMACCKEDMGTVWDYKPREYCCCPDCSYALLAWNLIARIKQWSVCYIPP